MIEKEINTTLKQIKEELILLSGLVEKAMRDSVTALRDHDFKESKRIIHSDKEINRKRFALEGIIIDAIASHKPLMQDLRALTSMLDMCSELERMGDYAKGLAALNLRSEGLAMPNILSGLHYMAEQVVDMLHRAMLAFVNEDVETAKSIVLEDDLIDALYREIYFEAMDVAMEDSKHLEQVNFVLWSAHNLERFADRVKNICERTIYSAEETNEVPPESLGDVLVRI